MNIENLCQICRENSSPYKCPKCRLRYCSLKCYQSEMHRDCRDEFEETELFGSTTFDGQTTNNFVRERIDDILKRKHEEKDFHDEQDDENLDELLSFSEQQQQNDEQIEEGDEAEERIDDDGDDEPVPELPDDFDESDEKTNQLWDILTSEEKREFQTMLKDGRISHLLNDYKPWKPWWLFKTSAPSLITDVDAPTTEPVKFPETIPSIPQSIVPLPSLTSILPHVHVRFDLFEILFAYVLMTIRYRSEFSSYLIESSKEFFSIASRHLTSPMINDENPFEVLQTRISLIRECLNSNEFSFRISEEFFLNLIVDVRQIVHGPYPREKSSNLYVLSALSDIKRFLTELHDYKAPMENVSNEKNVFHQHRQTPKKNKISRPKTNWISRKLLQNLRRKIDYLLSWTISHADRLIILDNELELIENDLRRRFDDYQRDKNRIEQNFQKIRFEKSSNVKSRIEEL